MLALIGSNGAGKTTLVNLISGLIPRRLRPHRLPGAGRHARPSVHQQDRARHRAQLPARQPLRPAQRARQRGAGHLLPRGQDAEAALAGRRRHRGAGRGDGGAASSSGWTPKAGSLAGGLSQGERKLLDVAVAYALRPKLLFLDEPTSGVSTREKAPIMDMITAVVRSGGITAVIIEHDMDVVFTYCPPDRGHAPGHDPRRRHAGRDPEPSASDCQPARRPRSEPPEPMLELERLERFRGPAQVLRDLSLTVGDRRVGVPGRAQRRGQDHDHRQHHGPAAGAERPRRLRGRGHHASCPRTERALAGHRLLARGRGDLPRPDGRRELPDQPVARPGGREGRRRGRGQRHRRARARALPRDRRPSPAGAGSSSRAARRRWWPSGGR